MRTFRSFHAFSVFHFLTLSRLFVRQRCRCLLAVYHWLLAGRLGYRQVRWLLTVDCFQSRGFLLLSSSVLPECQDQSLPNPFARRSLCRHRTHGSCCQCRHLRDSRYRCSSRTCVGILQATLH